MRLDKCFMQSRHFCGHSSVNCQVSHDGCRQTSTCTGWCTTRQAQQTWTFRSSNTGNRRCQLGSDIRENSNAKFSGFVLDCIVGFQGCTIGQNLACDWQLQPFYSYLTRLGQKSLSHMMMCVIVTCGSR